MSLITTAVATAAASAMALGAASTIPESTGAQHAAGVPAAARATVAYNWWRGDREQRRYYASVRPRVLGSFGEPISGIRWAYWDRNTARGRGLLVHMSCQPCHLTIYLHGVRASHGTRYFGKLRDTFADQGGTYNLHWTGRDWTG